MQQRSYPTGAMTESAGPEPQPGSQPAPEPALPPAPSQTRLRRPSPRVTAALIACAALQLLTAVPPLVSLNRYQRRVTTSMSQVLGRPVHLDHITLNLLPLPSFTLENFVIDEVPPFGAEPIIRANSVNARLRIGSLWRHRVEFSRITFTDPSVNLVHLPDGRWNLSGILLQASHLDTAPTTQSSAGHAPRFPYIEATGSRINLKLGQEKTPNSLTEADFSNTGTLQIEAGLERATTLGEVPLIADATWTDAPLGATSRILTGGDAGVRGQMNLSAHLSGQLSSARLQVRTEIDSLHRADFVPEHSLFVDMECTALATHVFHSFEDLRCSWPVPDSKGATIALTGVIPDVLSLRRSAQFQIGTARLPASVLTTWAHVLSVRLPADTRADGFLAATAHYPGATPGAWEGHASLEGLTLAGGHLGDAPLPIGDAALTLASAAPADSTAVTLAPLELSLGPHEPAVLEGSANAEGYTLHLAGLIAIPRLLALAATAPQFGEGLAAVLPRNRAPGPTRLDLTAHRSWGGAQVWTDTLARPLPPPPPRSSRPVRRRR